MCRYILTRNKAHRRNFPKCNRTFVFIMKSTPWQSRNSPSLTLCAQVMSGLHSTELVLQKHHEVVFSFNLDASRASACLSIATLLRIGVPGGATVPVVTAADGKPTPKDIKQPARDEGRWGAVGRRGSESTWIIYLYNHPQKASLSKALLGMLVLFLR